MNATPGMSASAGPAGPAAQAVPPRPRPDRLVDERAAPEQRTWATFNHLVGLLAIMDGLGLVSFIATVVMWRLKRDESPFLDDHGREATNFQLSAFLITLVGTVIGGVLVLVIIGIALLPMFMVFMVVIRLVGGIRAAMAANRGEFYRYPMCFQLL